MKCMDLFVWPGFTGYTATKTRLVMKLIAILTIVATLQVSGKGFSQVTLMVKNASIKSVFQKIKEQAGVTFYYNESLLDSSRQVTIQIENASLKEALDSCFAKQPFTYKLVDNTVVITPHKKGRSEPTVAADDWMFRFVRITGIIKDEAGKPMSAASVKNLRTQQSVAAGADGRFSIDGNVDDALQFTSIGYAPVTRRIAADKLFLEIVMQVQVTGLSDMVVVGYGATRKKDLTGSVSVIASKDIQDIPFVTVDNALAGKAAGVQVTKTDGTPGGAVRIRVRGSTSLLGGNDPLYVIDGVPVQVQSNYINPGFDVTSPVANAINGYTGLTSGMSAGFVNGLNSVGGLNVDDIESITILKDASSTGIYGSKAANGVVIITTKRGKKDMKPQIMFSYYGTYSKPVTPDVLDADQYKMLFRESAQNDYDYRQAAGKYIFPQLDAIVNHPETWFGKANTDWIKEVTRNTFSNNADISVQGGGAASKYYSSIAYNNTPGAVIGSTYQRVSGKLNVENEIGSHFRFITNLNMGFIEQNITNGVYSQAIQARPDFAPYDSTGNYASFENMGYFYQGFQNPLALSSAINNAKTFSLMGSVSGIYDFNSFLSFKSTVSLNMQNYSQRLYTPSYIVVGSQTGRNIENNGGVGNNSNSQLTNWFIENTLTYDRTFREKHAINVLAGTSYETRKTSFFSATASGYPNDNILNSLSSAVTPLITQGDNPRKPQSYLVSYYLRANYGYMDKYLFTFTGRADGSSKFGDENKFGYFPSGAIAWRISKENFLKNVSWIDDIKLRGSYGITGTQNIGDQMYRTLYSPYSYNGVSALVPSQLGNEAIKWETTAATDAGIDFSFFKNRLQGTVDYYHKQTSNALISLPLAPSSSYYSLLYNVAGIRNNGYEVSLQGDIIRTRNFRWNASVNITWNKSKVTKLDTEADIYSIGNLTGLEIGNTTLIEGQPLGLIIGMKINGIIKTQKQLNDYKAALGANADEFAYLSLGDAMFELDATGYPARDLVIGSAAPNYFGGFTHQLTYKNFDLSLYFTYSQGGHLMWGDGVSSIHFVGQSNANVEMLKRYHSGNTNADYPRLVYNDEYITANTNLSIYKSSYVKLRTATFNYRFNRAGWMRRTGMQNMSVFLSATNLFTITAYPGNDPETSDDPYSVAGGYFDVSNYPTLRTFSAGVKVGF